MSIFFLCAAMVELAESPFPQFTMFLVSVLVLCEKDFVAGDDRASFCEKLAEASLTPTRAKAGQIQDGFTTGQG